MTRDSWRWLGSNELFNQPSDPLAACSCLQQGLI